MIAYKSYNFIDKDPIIDEVRTILEKEKVTHTYIEDRSGVTTQTLRNWFSGSTKKPQTATVRAVLRAIGYDMQIVRSNVVPLHQKYTHNKKRK